MKKKALVLLASFAFTHVAFATLPVGQEAPAIKLEGKEGGRVTGEAWNSQDMKGKVHVLFYVAPGEKDLNKAATDKLKEQNFPDDKYASVAVVNMAASWIPDAVLAKKIKASQEEFPKTIYVKDTASALVKNWKLADNSNDVVVFDKTGKVIFSFDGKLEQPDIDNLVTTIKNNL